MSLFISSAERWAFVVVVCLLALIILLLFTSCQMPLRT